MPDRSCWYFCRSCGYRGRFVAKEDEPIRCPDCYKHGREKSIMRRQDVEWAKKETVI